ncbi:slipin family protein [Undibacterium sp. LX40W]|uniref:Slipin family protein n=1 Tax=Undibacterium nitidum TaxID=2762298 RepID=A0A923KM32_9BURK|nr:MULTISPECIES: slipin family protein [Undibacterium]MBC3882480.1 slipin family protein [Undibacterium nitidum]MBC3892761.1 slipin family protein [Undibacterium sp. LX40W]
MKIKVQKNERAILFKDKAFEAILAPGEYRFLDLFGKYSAQIFDMDNVRFQHACAESLRRHEVDVVNENFYVVDVADEAVVLRYENQSLVEILAPGTRKMYWKFGAEQEFQTIDISANFAVSKKLLGYLAQPTLRGKEISGLQNILSVQIPESHLGLLKVDGKLVEVLAPGKTAYWRFNRDIQVETVDTRIQALEVSGQEILTSDKVSLRVNLNANWLFEDVKLAYSRLAKPAEHIYRELQFALRAAVGTRSLDELLENKQIIDTVVNQHLEEKLQGFGVKVLSVGVKDIVLPGDMKVLLAQVVEAEKAAQANVIRRREETNATRSMLNTARVMENNPTALRLKELETLEKIAERIDKISVFGGLDQVLNGLVKLKV